MVERRKLSRYPQRDVEAIRGRALRRYGQEDHYNTSYNKFIYNKQSLCSGAVLQKGYRSY